MFCEFADLSGLQIAEYHIFYGGADEALATVIDCTYHLPDLVKLALCEGDGEPCVWNFFPKNKCTSCKAWRHIYNLYLAGRSDPVAATLYPYGNACPQYFETLRCDLMAYLHEVGALMWHGAFE